jgi:hypothetical protein
MVGLLIGFVNKVRQRTADSGQQEDEGALFLSAVRCLLSAV